MICKDCQEKETQLTMCLECFNSLQDRIIKAELEIVRLQNSLKMLEDRWENA